MTVVAASRVNEREIERIRMRCVCGDDGCWLWSGSMNSSGLPTLCRIVDGKKTNSSARRWVFLMSGRRLETSDQVITTCEQANCLNPAHLKKTSRSAIQRENNQKDPSLALRRGVSIKAAWNRRGGGLKLTQEKADYARTSEKAANVVAQELGVSAATVRYIRAGKLWRQSPSNPFAGLLAANDSKRKAA
jgi:hypothetical protein